MGQANGSAGASINQITWQVGSLAEVVNGDAWVADQGQHLLRSGRDMPGSNWHTYLFDPEGHINELYYGMEQIGWDGLSKPRQMWSGVLTERPGLPQPAEATEVENALSTGIGIASGHRPVAASSPSYPVDGVMMTRPFKIVGIGPVSLFVADLEQATRFYRDILGFTERTSVEWNGHRGVMLSASTDHHNLALYELGLRSALQLSDQAGFAGARVPARQLPPAAAAVAHMLARGAEEVTVPGRPAPGLRLRHAPARPRWQPCPALLLPAAMRADRAPAAHGLGTCGELAGPRGHAG